MSRRARKVWAIAMGTVAVLAAAGWILAHPQTRDPYRFLDGHPVRDVGVLPPGSWPATEVRLYSWRGSWQEVAATARRELRTYGLTERPRLKEYPDETNWMGEPIDGGPCGINSEIRVTVMRGRAESLSYSSPPTDGDPGWVTVVVASFLDDRWINVVRTTLFGVRD